MLDRALLKSSAVGNRKVVSLLVRYGARNFEECIEASHQTNHISAFLFLCLSAQKGDSDAIEILLHPNEEDVMDRPRFAKLGMYKLILEPLLRNGRFSLSIPIHVALLEGQVAVAGEIIRLSSSRPRSGMIDWHDLEVNHMDSSWFDIPGISHLIYIGLSSNRLRCLPERVLSFHSLQKLQIHHNCISYLPAQLFNMANIKDIDASFNKIVSLPEALPGHPLTSTLEILNLANNKLTDLPTYFINSKIKHLDISFNRLNRVPECVIHLHRMATLCLDYNVGIEFIPYELGSLQHLSLLSLKGLPYMKNIPNTSNTSPLQFLRSRSRSLQSFSQYDVAIITNDSYNDCKGIVLPTVQQHSKRKHYSLLKYSNSKQFLHFQSIFSLPCTVYLIVWDCQGEQPADDLFPIIAHLAVYAPNSHIIVAACWVSAITPGIQSKTQDQIKNSSWKTFEKRGLLTVLTICVDKDALVSRSNSLQYLTDILHRKGETSATYFNIPNSYCVLQNTLRQHANSLMSSTSPPLINKTELWDLIRECQHNDLAGHKELPMLISFLTDISFLLCLTSNRISESNIYILNKQWFLDTISGLLEQHQNVRSQTGLHPSHFLGDLMACPSLQSGLPYALSLFVSQMGLAISVTSVKSLVPVMLPGHNTDSSADFSSQYEVRRVYTFALTPQAFWGRLIAHLLINMEHLISMASLDSAGEVVEGFKELSENLPGEEIVNYNYWKEGMVVYLAGASLLFSVEAIQPLTEPDYCEGLEIRVQNNSLGMKAMNIITTVINSLLKNWYQELWQTVSISIPCPECVKMDKYTLFPFLECCQTVAKGRQEGKTQCPHHNIQPFLTTGLVLDLARDNPEQTIFTSTESVRFSVGDKSTCVSQPPAETVFKGEFGDCPVAVKPFPPPVPNGERSLTPFLDFWHEFTILTDIRSQASNPYVIDLLISIPNPLALVFPYAQYCSLEEVVQEKQIPLSPLLRIRMLYQLAHALNFLHSLKVIHRNVCLANIFVFSLSLDDTVNVKLGGFSDSCIALNQGLAVGEHGTFPAPEMGKPGYQYDERVDVFAYAFTAYEILSRKLFIFRRGVRFQAASSASDRPSLSTISKIAPHFVPVIEKCWNSDESKRPFFGTILAQFQNPLHVIIREGDRVNELQDFNAAAMRFTRKHNGTFKGDLYQCSSIYSVEDSATLAHLCLPGLKLQESTSLPSRLIICMCCTAQYLWISFQHRVVKIYSTDTLAFIKEIQFEHHVLVMAISPDSVYLGLENGEVQMYNMSSPSPLHSPQKTRIISFQKAIEAIQVLEDCIICCTQNSCIRVHPQSLHPIQEFPVVSETGVKFTTLCIDRDKDEEYLWVGFRRLQQLVVFNAITGRALYGANCCEVLNMERNRVWVTSMLSVLDTVWVGLNTGHVLVFHAFSQDPHLLTYFKVHTEKVDKLMLLQPAYWGSNTPNYYYEQSLTDSEESEEGEVERNSFLLPLPDPTLMPRSMLVMSCGKGIEQSIPKIGSDGTVMMDQVPTANAANSSGSSPHLYLLMMDAPDSSGAHKLECQAHRAAVPYMYTYKRRLNMSDEELFLSDTYAQENGLSDSLGSPTISHRDIPGERPNNLDMNGEETNDALSTPELMLDPNLKSFEIVSHKVVVPSDDLCTKLNAEACKKARHNKRLSDFIPKIRRNKSPPRSCDLANGTSPHHVTTEVTFPRGDSPCMNGSVSGNKTPPPKPKPTGSHRAVVSDSDSEGECDPYVQMRSTSPIMSAVVTRETVMSAVATRETVMPIATQETIMELNTSLPG